MKTYVCNGYFEDDDMQENPNGQWVKKEDVPQWISVESELPENPMPCLVYIKDRDSVMVTYFNGDFTLVRVGYETGFSAHGVTHWMPLPSAPNHSEEE